MKVRIHAGRAAGEVLVPPSKSVAHRMLICAGLAEGVSTVRNAGDCEDILATLDCLSRLGADYRREGDTVTVRGGLLRATPTEALPCRESGSTLRFLIPLALTARFPVAFTGYGRLPERPQTVYETICAGQGLTFTRDGQTIRVCGPLRGGDFRVAGNISSQFVTGLLFALPTLPEPSRITLLPPVESRSYIDLTLDVLKKFGIRAEWENGTSLAVPCGQRFMPCDCEAEGDWSAGAFWEALGRMGDNRVRIPNLNPNSRQGDRVCTAYFDALRGGFTTLSLADCPDLGPMLFAYAAATHGGTFTEVGRLRIKESDRIGAMREELAKFGVELSDSGDTVTVRGGTLHAPGAPLNGHGDHRIVMALAILATRTGGEIEGAEAVRKSYPSFWKDLGAFGIRCELI